jgi:SAM-dependent methyltransferase
MTDTAAAASLFEAVLKDEIVRMYQEVADNPKGTFHFLAARRSLFGYAPAFRPRPAAPSPRSPGSARTSAATSSRGRRFDLGSGAGLDAIIASWCVGPGGKVIGVDLNPTMCRKTQAHAAATGARVECQVGPMENIPVPTASVDVVISNGVINLSFRKRRVIEEIFRVLRPGGGSHWTS